MRRPARRRRRRKQKNMRGEGQTGLSRVFDKYLPIEEGSIAR
jgi:hypothetical protein